ncbi:MAG: amidohydrolase family protein [Bacteroidetes bacterium]|nr:amidohydrolase family protein [Bacteroidota bacterium]
MPTILKNATFIDSNSFEFKKTNIIVSENKNIIFENNVSLIDKYPNATIINCEGKFVTKSFACGHHHVYSALARGMGAPKKQPENFYEVLQYIWWTLDKCLDLEIIEASALATAIACAKNGVTFAIDHHASPFSVEGSLETIARAFDKVGVSHLLCYEISNRDGDEIAEKGLAETENYLKTHQGLVGLHASFTVNEKTLISAVNLANKYNSGLHIHVAEDNYDQKHCLENYNKRVVERLFDKGVLNSSKTILGHCLHLNDNEKEIISKSPVWVVQNTDSNLNNNVGYFNAAGLGDNIFLGTDGMHSDMLKSMKSAFFVGQGFDNINFSSAYQRLRNVNKYISQNEFSGDDENNLVVFDYDTPTEMNSDNFLGHLIFGLESKHVNHVISNGKLIVKDKEILTINEAESLDFAKEMGKKLWAEMKKN